MKHLIQAILDETGYHGNPYFQALRDGSFSKEDFVETQIQFYFAVDFFNRPITMLAAKIPVRELRIKVLRNAWEEHGDGNLEQAHGLIFLEFLDRLAAVTWKDIDRRALWPEIRAFNTVLAGACTLDDYLIGTGMLCIIERMFLDISGWIGRGILERGWLAPERMIHYDAHEQIDVRHAQELFEVLEPAWQELPENRYYIEQGLRLGATVFDQLYRGLYQKRTRRIFRNISGLHSRA